MYYHYYYYYYAIFLICSLLLANSGVVLVLDLEGGVLGDAEAQPARHTRHPERTEAELLDLLVHGVPCALVQPHLGM